MTELWQLTATGLAGLIRARKVSAREAAAAALARLDAVNPKINAVVAHNPEAVLADADAIDAALARGFDPGPLAGVPVTIKANIDQLGFPTTNGLAGQKALMPTADSPVVSNLRRAGAVALGRTNTPAFSLRWFTSNKLHGATANPRNPALTPGGSSGGAAAATAAGIGAIGHGTDIAGSIRYPAYACGIHGLRPSLGRVPAYNASGAERGIGGQLMAVSGPLARSVADLRLALAAMAAPDPRDPWYIPAPLEGPPAPRRAALCLRPGGLAIVPEVEAALRDAALRLAAAGWVVEEIADTPPLAEAVELQSQLWLGHEFGAAWAAAEAEGDPGALAVLGAFRERAQSWPADIISRALIRRSALIRLWQLFFAEHPVLLLPVSGELPFENELDRRDPESFWRIWAAQAPMIGLPLMGLPGITVSTGMVGATPVGVQIAAAPYREDLCLLAGEAVEAGGTPPSAADPA